MTCVPPTPPDAAAEWRGVTVRYPYRGADAVGPVTFYLGRGERVLLLGPTGSGKSTLLNALTGIVPHVLPAEIEGSVLLDGEAVDARPPSAWSARVARLFQDAGQTLCGMRVGDEIAFALENRALPEAEIGRRVGSAMRKISLTEEARDRRTATLSGGEKQLVALAAALAQDAPLFLADEPAAHLSPAAAARFRALLEQPDGRTFLVIDHRVDEFAGCFDRVAVIGADGRLVAEGDPRFLFRERYRDLAALGIAMPTAAALDACLAGAGLAPAMPPRTVAEALDPLDPADPAAVSAVRAFVAGCVADKAEDPGETAARLEDASCAPLFGPVVLGGVGLEIRRGEAVAILGPNGAGKSTLAAGLAGLLRLKKGRRSGPPGGIAFQNPEAQFTGGSVLEEMKGALANDLAAAAREEAARAALADWGLDRLAAAHPFELSQGQKRRLALATLSAAGRWPLLVLDEPTAGLDAAGAEMVAAAIRRFRAEGRAVALVTHEPGFALATCPRAVVVAEGGILADGPTPEILADAALLARAGLAEPAILPALRWLERDAAC